MILILNVLIQKHTLIHICVCLCVYTYTHIDTYTEETSQELRMLSSVTINCQITKIVMNSGSQLSEL